MIARRATYDRETARLVGPAMGALRQLYAELHYAHPLLESAEAERALIESAQAGDSYARTALLEANIRLVIDVARTHWQPGRGTLDLMDLISEGMFGLMRAVDKFDCAKGHKLSTYAVPWIRRLITRAQQDHDRLIRLPVHMGERIGAVRGARAAWMLRTGDEPTAHELAQELALTTQQVADALRWLSDALSLDAPASLNPREPDVRSLGETIAAACDPVASTIVERHYQAALAQDLALSIAQLPEREREAVERYYRHGQTYRQIGAALGVSHELARQIANNGLKLLREQHGAQLAGYL